MNKLVWYSNRLRSMSAREIVSRFKLQIQSSLESAGLFSARNVPAPNLNALGCQWIDKPEGIAPQAYLSAADAILDGKIDIFALDNLRLGENFLWNRDYKTGIVAPFKYGFAIDYRDPAVVGDIKYLWEPNRHLHLVTLAQAWSLTQERKYQRGLMCLLESWLQQCPYPYGPNWTSSLELGIRLINWAILWQLIGGLQSSFFETDDGKAFLNTWLISIYQHAHFIKRHLSHHSSANNHLIGEAAGLFCATATWPYWKGFKKWQLAAHNILIEEAAKQNGSDGVNREQAIAYQQFVLDLLIIPALMAQNSAMRFPENYWLKIECMLEYIASVMDVAGNIPMIGDADDGYVVRLSQENNFCPFKSLLNTGAILFQRGDFKQKGMQLDDKTRWLSGNNTTADYKRIRFHTNRLPVRRSFPDGGYYIMGKNFEKENEIRSIVDCGPLGYLSIAAHGHADALSMTLSVNGKEFFIDPGTYAYHTENKWRNYFKGTAAHNTVRVDGENQSIIGGNFMWLKKASATCKQWQSNKATDWFIGYHDGYMRLTDPVLHQREIRFDKNTNTFLIIDQFTCQKKHTVERFWHLSESCNFVRDNHTVIITNDNARIAVQVYDPQGELIIYRGNDRVPAGWISRGFDIKMPTTTLSWKNTINKSCRLKTKFYVNSTR